MNRFSISLIVLSSLLFGCTSAKKYIHQSPKPTPFRAPGKPLPPAEAQKLYSQYRGYVNDYGVQIGRRHFNVERLPEYLRDSRFEHLGQRTDKVYWAKILEKKEASRGNSNWVSTGGGANSMEAALAIIAVVVVAASLESYFHKKNLSKLRHKTDDSTDSLENIMTSYNRLLAHSLGITLSAGSAYAVKEVPETLPTLVQLGVNSTQGDWLEDYQFRQQGAGWYFGYQHCKPLEILNKFQPEAGPDPFKWSRRLPYLGMALDTLGAIALGVGIYMVNNRYDHQFDSYVNPTAAIVGGVVLGTVGISCHWQASSIKRNVKEKFNLKIKSQLFPSTQ